MWLYGAGGHAKVVLDCLWSENIPINGIFDDNPAINEVNSVPVVGKYNPYSLADSHLLIAIGDNFTRRQVAQQVHHPFGNTAHSSAIISPFSQVGEGTVVFHRSVIQAGTVIGKHGIVNTAVVIEHDCILGNFVHIAPGAILCGQVRVGEGSLIGVGATLLPGIVVGKWCVVGAGAVVTKSLPDFTLAVGIPAKISKHISPFNF
jgi:sugar O-acyltransferase (sialic acid O-acetyltransferase NeuD family)